MASSDSKSPDNGGSFESSDSAVEQAIFAAQRGDKEAAGRLLELCRDYLLLIANQDFDQDLRHKMAPSDLVQESMLTAQAQFASFSGSTPQELRAWLRGVLQNDLRHWRRHYKGVQKRGVQREAVAGGSPQGCAEPIDSLQTPGTHAAALEEAELLGRAMATLSANDQLAIHLRNWEEQTFEEIGQQLGCSEDAARKLWSRAVIRLKEVLVKEWPQLNPDLLSDEPP